MAPPICLVDDEPSVLQSLGRLLRSDGLASVGFSDPAAFLEHARIHDVAVAVVDIHMPGMTGLEVLEAMRTVSPRARVIIITGDDHPRCRRTALAAGAYAFLHKLCLGDLFLSEVRKALATSDDPPASTPL